MLAVPCRSHTTVSPLEDNASRLASVASSVRLLTYHFQPGRCFNVIDAAEIFARVIRMQLVDGQFLSKHNLVRESTVRRVSYFAPLDSKWYFKPWKISTLFFSLENGTLMSGFRRPRRAQRTIEPSRSACRRRIEMSFVHLPLYI